MTMRLSSILMTAAAVLLAAGCKPAAETAENETLVKLRKAVDAGKYMYAHQDDLCYGHDGWYQVEGGSDVKYVCGDYPAVVGFDLGDIEHADSLHNIDGVSFDFMRKAAEAHVARGGLVTFSWHPDNLFTGGDAWDISSDSVVVSILPGGKHHEEFMGWLERAADFLESIKAPQGHPIKAIYRPWHEHMARWFWWGAPHCTKEQYIALWKLNYDYFVKERGLTNLVWAFSPNGDVDKEGYMERYPGDDMVDILGLDAYQKDGMEVAAVQALLKDRLAYMKELAAEHGKITALTETGYESIPDPQWWTGTLAPALEGSGISYVLTWRNAYDRPMHFYGPWKGAACEEDFVKFHDLESTLFLKDIVE